MIQKSPPRLPHVVYHVTVRLADHEWQSTRVGAAERPIMEQIARDLLAQHDQPQPLFVRVQEHAGWYEEFALHNGHVICIGTANRASQQPDALTCLEICNHAKWIMLPTIDRPQLQEVSAAR